MAPLGASFSSLENELDLETSFYFKESSLETENSFFTVEKSGDPMLTMWLGLISSIVSHVGDTDLRYDVIRRAVLSSQNPRPQSNQEKTCHAKLNWGVVCTVPGWSCSHCQSVENKEGPRKHPQPDGQGAVVTECSVAPGWRPRTGKGRS